MVGLDEEFCGIGKGLVPSEPCGLRVAVGADDRQPFDAFIKSPGDLEGAWFCGKQTIFVNEHVFSSSFSRRSRSASGSIAHAVKDAAHVSEGLDDAGHGIVAVDLIFKIDEALV